MFQTVGPVVAVSHAGGWGARDGGGGEDAVNGQRLFYDSNSGDRDSKQSPTAEPSNERRARATSNYIAQSDPQMTNRDIRKTWVFKKGRGGGDEKVDGVEDDEK